MPYPTKLLNDGEEIVADLHPHWWHFAEPVGALVGAVILGILMMIWDAADWLMWIPIVLILGCAAWTIQRYVGWVSTNFVVTNQRVIFREGILTKTGIEIPLDRVNTVHFSQRLIERLLGAGDLMIESAGTDGQQRFTDVRDPSRVQRLIHEQMELREQHRLGYRAGTAAPPQAPDPVTSRPEQAGGGLPAPPPAPTGDVVTQLEKLEGMLDRGTLTQEEFDAQKRRLLGG